MTPHSAFRPQSRRDFFARVLGVGVAAVGGASALASCSGNGDPSGGDGPVNDPLAVKGGPKTTPRKDVIYPDGYVGPMASDKGPIVVKGKTAKLRVVVPQDTEVGDWKTNVFTKWYQERTGVEIEWQVIGGEQGSAEQMTKVNAMVASGDVPDVFMNISFTPSQMLLYGSQKLFLPLEKYIDEYGVEIKRVFKDYPDTKDLITAPDGHIYCMPYVNDCYHCCMGNRMWIYQPWLDKLGLPMPETLDDLEAVLEAFMKRDPNGNGKADELPLMADVDTSFDSFIMGSFMYNPGSPWLVVENGKVDVIYNKDGWREGLRYLDRLYKKGLIGKAAFTQNNETLQRQGNAKDPILGVVRSFYWGSFMELNDDDPKARFRDYKAIPILKGPDGTRVAGWGHYTWIQLGRFVVTNACKNPAVAVMWADGQYELETQMRSYSGEPGKGWRYAKQDEVGINGKQALWTSLGTWPPKDGHWWGQQGVNYRSSDYRLGELSDPKHPTFEKPLYENTKEAYFPYAVEKERQLPPLYMTEEQAQLTGEVQTTLTNHVQGSIAKFALGQLDINDDAVWKKYTDTIEQMGLERYLQAHQQAYDSKYGKK